MKTMSIYAEALISNREYKNARITGKLIGVEEARTWTNLVKNALLPAYAIRKYRYDNMGNTEALETCDMSKLYDAIRPIIALIGEVNGDKLNAVNVAEEFIAQSVKFKVIDITNEMASTRCKYLEARKVLNEYDPDRYDPNAKPITTFSDSIYQIALAKGMSDEEAKATATTTLYPYPSLEEVEERLEDAKVEVARLESEPGNCKRITVIQTESAFTKAIEIALGDAITKQTLRPIEDILAEKAAKEAERKAKRKANKLAKQRNK
jgi:hypothetical protein